MYHTRRSGAVALPPSIMARAAADQLDVVPARSKERYAKTLVLFNAFRKQEFPDLDEADWPLTDEIVMAFFGKLRSEGKQAPTSPRRSSAS